MKIGIGRDVAKGVVLMRKGFFDFEGSEHTATSPSGTPFSKAFSNMKDLFGAPFCSSKASDMVLIKWLHWFVSLNILNSIVDGTTLGLNKTYSHGPWVLFSLNCTPLLRGYAALGRRSTTVRIKALIMKPKRHALHHLA